jgi:hypothetical protein
MFKTTVGALSLLCLVFAGYIAETSFNRFNQQRFPFQFSDEAWAAIFNHQRPPYQISDETMAAVLENARQMNTPDPLTGETKVEATNRRAKESAEALRIAQENVLGAKTRLKAELDKIEALQAEKERILNKYR